MTPARIRALMIVLALVGLADAAYLADMAFMGQSLVCDIGAGLDGCNAVAQSEYSRFLGQPLALYGVIFYVAFLAVLFLKSKLPHRLYQKKLILLAGIGVAFSTYFLYLQQFVIEALCIYCLVSALISYILAVLVYLGRDKEQHSEGSSAPVQV